MDTEFWKEKTLLRPWKEEKKVFIKLCLGYDHTCKIKDFKWVCLLLAEKVEGKVSVEQEIKKGNDSEIYEIWYGNGLDFTIIDREKVIILSVDGNRVVVRKK